jgi:hypothetical protein
MAVPYRRKLGLGWSFLWRAQVPSFIAGALSTWAPGLDGYLALQWVAMPFTLFIAMPWGAAAVLRRLDEPRFCASCGSRILHDWKHEPAPRDLPAQPIGPRVS